MNGWYFVILLKFTAVISQYEYIKPPRQKNVHQFALNTLNWDVGADGERFYVFGMTKSSPNVCNVRFRLGTMYLDCEDEYVIIGGKKICGRLEEYFEFPYSRGEWNLRYRGKSHLEIHVEQVECRENYQSCDVTIRDLTGEITSPNYPDGYPAFSNCQFTILPANEAICQISIYFHDFDVEDSPDCMKDRLIIGDEPFCGRVKNYRTVQNLTDKLVLRFLSDSSVSGRGFRINVGQIHCGNTLRYSIGQCCSREFSDPYMILISPGFLGSQLVESNCQYTIYQSQPNNCRLRFRFKHFWIGEENLSYGCVNGYLQIDERRFCGCLDGHEHVTQFENGRKELLYNYRGQGNRGFVIEVFQEECEKEFPTWNSTDVDPDTEIEVFMTNITSEKTVNRFLLPRDASRCYYWNHPGWAREVLWFLNNSPIPTFCEDKRTIYNSFTASQFSPLIPEVHGLPPLIPPEFPLFTPPVTPPQVPVFRPPLIPPGFPPQNWVVLNKIMGQLFSPGYPGSYPKNLRVNYVFQPIPGYCRLQISFRNFDLEKSFKCKKDYLQVGGNFRYCGNYLRGKTNVFNFQPTGWFILLFVTDGCFSGSGFFGTYKQIPCVVPYAKLNGIDLNSSKPIVDE